MIELQFTGSVPKYLDRPEWNEDYFESGGELPLFTCALSDGASVSFSPRMWARLVVKRFLSNPVVDESWLLAAQSCLEVQYDRASFDLLDEIAAREQGSFASLLGLRYDPADNSLLVTAVGDSLLAIVDDRTSEVKRTFPYQQSSQFASSPLLLPSLPGATQSVFAGDAPQRLSLSPPMEEWHQSRLLLMTDAIGAWFLKSVEDHDRRWEQLLSLTSDETFRELVTTEREARRLRMDDATIAVLTCAIPES